MAWITARSYRLKIVPSLPVGDFTPDPFSVYSSPTMSYLQGSSPRSNTMRITGVDSSIDIRLVQTSGVAATVYYKISSGRLNPDDYQFNPGSWTVLNFTLNTSATITVTNNYNFGFAVVLSAPGSNVYQIQNVSDANIVLNTFTHEMFALNYDYGSFFTPTGLNRDHGTFTSPAAFNEDFNVIP
jgi:hypothetical protein